MAEIAPVVGGAFVWRTIARSLVGFFPAYVSAVPKTAVAYVGTYTVGEIARYYYASGKRPSPGVIEAIRAEGTRLFKVAAARLGLREGDDR